MAEPSEFKAEFRRVAIGFRFQIWHGHQMVRPFDEHDTTWALTLRRAERKAARWIERRCTPADEPLTRMGDALVRSLEAERRADHA
jgi:hypothetical protein